MTTNPSHPLHHSAFPLLSQLSRRLQGRATAPAEVLDAVGLLTATADPARAERLRPRPGEPAPVVERLAVWALHRVDADTVVLAHHLLQGADARTAPVRQPTPATC